MIERIVITKIIRAAFGRREPVEVMIGFYDVQGRQVGSQLISAELFDEEITEMQSVNFQKDRPHLHIADFSTTLQ